MKLFVGGCIAIAGFAGILTASTHGWSQAAMPRHANNPGATHAKIDWNATLPSAAELKQRVLDNLKNSEAEQERYVCKTTRENDETDKNGNIKKRQVKQYDMFFVNGQEIDELKSKDGKPLNVGRQKQEAERIQKQIQKDSDVTFVAKKNADNAKQIDMLLHMLRFTKGHRIDLRGRVTLAYDLSGDSHVHPKGVEETFLHNMAGNIQVDEATGELVDLNARLDHDVKIGAGLLANLHKGFWIHVSQQRYPDGVWLPELVEGNGDARAALFFHPYFKFRQTINGCVLTNVSTSEKTAAVE